MRPDSRACRLALTAAVVTVISVGCARTAPVRFYVLSSPPELAAESQRPMADSPAIGIGPVKLPAYLERPQIVTRAGDNEVRLAEFDRWAEPLRENLVNVLAENLASLLSTDHVVIYPWSASTPVRYQVRVDIIRFEAVQGTCALLTARWSLFDPQEKTAFETSTSSYEEPAGDDTYPARVAALSRTVVALARDIAAAIRRAAASNASR